MATPSNSWPIKIKGESMNEFEYKGMKTNATLWYFSRGGRVAFQGIDAPKKYEWKTALEAVEDALLLEKTVNQVKAISEIS